MYCSSCGRQVADGARFCPWCGAATSVAGEGGEKGPGQAPGYGAAPGSGGQGAAPAQDPTPEVPRTRGRLLIVLGIVAAVLLLVLGACALLRALGSGDAVDDVEDEASEVADVVTTVAYYGSEDAVTVTSSTHIVLWDDDGEAIEEFDLYLADDETGEVTRYAVDGGGFTPEGLGIPAGTYAMAARDTDAGEMYSVPVLVVTDDASGAADADETDATDDADETNASDDTLTYDAELVLRPDPDATDDDSEVSDLAYLYSLYYDKVLEYQALYGEATVSEDGTAVSGVALVLLEDLDADGTKELVVVWCESADWDAARGVEVWGWDAESRALEHLCSEGLHHANDLQAVWVYGEGSAGAILTWQYVDDTTWTDYTLMVEDGALVLYTEVAPLSSDAFAYYRDGEAISYDDYYAAHEVLYRSADFERYDLWVYDEDGDSYEATQEVVAATEATIAELVEGMLRRSSDDETDVDELLATYATETFDYLAGGTYEGVYAGYSYSYMDSVPEQPLTWYVADLDGDGTSELVVIGSSYASNVNSAYGEWYDAVVTVYEAVEDEVVEAASLTLEDAVVPAIEQVSAQWGVLELGGTTYLAWEQWGATGYLADGVEVGFYLFAYDGVTLSLATSAYVIGSSFPDGSSDFEELFETLGVDGSFEDLLSHDATILGDYLGVEAFCTVTSELVVEYEDYASWRGTDDVLVVTRITITGQGD